MAYAWLLILLPFAGALWLAFKGRELDEEQIGRVAAGAVGAAFAIAVLLACHLLCRDREPVTVGGPTWIAVGKLAIGFWLRVDALSVVMSLVVTGVGCLIHLYARGYMHGDPHYPRFFALLNLFVGAMLVLVMADNLPLMFIGWEGVGFCSYMLIGYYTERQSATQAGKKAFIVNRIGDLGFLLGTFLTWNAFGTLRFGELAAAAPAFFSSGDTQLLLIALCFFVGACGKSAQFPLHVWLPDAMEGPTPVSALIHAATMVTAGVYLVVRLGVIYALAPVAMHLVAVVGLLTAVMAATIAMVQTDIKRVLAYSTVSQLGYMFLAAGVGAYTAAIFHLVTHAFFKGLLFLCSGSVIHAVEHALHAAGEHGDPQDMRHMGGLREKLPLTYRSMLAGSAAIAGVPLLSGFFSKDEILLQVGQHSVVLLIAGLLTALMTAFYMFRMMLLTFEQETRLSPAAYQQVTESSPVMTQPLLILAALSLAGGVLNLPGHTILSQWLARYLRPAIEGAELLLGTHEAPYATELRGMVISSLVALTGIWLAWSWYVGNRDVPRELRERYAQVYRTLSGLYYVDWCYQTFIVKPGHRASEWLAVSFDQDFLDGLVNGVGQVVVSAAAGLRRYQPGFVRSYALWFAVGGAGVLGSMGLSGSPWLVAGLVGLLVLALLGAAVVVARPREEA